MDVNGITAVHWNEERESWEEVGGLASEETHTVEVEVSSLSVFSTVDTSDPSSDTSELDAEIISCVVEPSDPKVGQPYSIVATIKNNKATTNQLYMVFNMEDKFADHTELLYNSKDDREEIKEGGSAIISSPERKWNIPGQKIVSCTLKKDRFWLIPDKHIQTVNTEVNVKTGPIQEYENGKSASEYIGNFTCSVTLEPGTKNKYKFETSVVIKPYELGDPALTTLLSPVNILASIAIYREGESKRFKEHSGKPSSDRKTIIRTKPETRKFVKTHRLKDGNYIVVFKFYNKENPHIVYKGCAKNFTIPLQGDISDDCPPQQGSGYNNPGRLIVGNLRQPLSGTPTSSLNTPSYFTVDDAPACVVTPGQPSPTPISPTTLVSSHLVEVGVLVYDVIQARENQTINIPVEITNTGSVALTFDVEVTSYRGSGSRDPVQWLGKRSVELEPDDFRTLAFPFVGESTGMYGLRVTVYQGNSTTELSEAQYDDLVRVVSSGSASSDRAALVALYNATDGPNWSTSTNWLSDRPLREWYGVGTDDSGRINSLALSENGLNGSIPSELGNLSNLERLYLGGNQLTGPIPSSLGNLTNLTWLSLDGNQLTGSVPSSLGNLVNLTELYLHSNQLSGTLPQSFTSITTLEDFHFGYNDGLCAPTGRGVHGLASGHS